MDDTHAIQLMVEALSATVDAALNHTQPPLCGTDRPASLLHNFHSHRRLPPLGHHHDGSLHSLQTLRQAPHPFRSPHNSFPLSSQIASHQFSLGDAIYPPTSAPMSQMGTPFRGNFEPEYDTSLKDFLEKLDLDEYCDAFLREDVTDVATLRHLESSDLKQIGLSLGKICKIRSALSQAPPLNEEAETPTERTAQKRKRNSDQGVEKDPRWPKARRPKSPHQISSPNFSPETWQKNSRKPFAEVHEMRPIVRIRLKELWPSFDKVFLFSFFFFLFSFFFFLFSFFFFLFSFFFFLFSLLLFN
jgi:hypothetical protein